MKEEYKQQLPELKLALQNASRLSMSVPAGVTKWEQDLPKEYSGKISNPLKALKRLYADLDRFYEHVLPSTPCKSGCSACCHYDVHVTELEAKYIEKGTKRRRVMPVALKYMENSYEPCTFLTDGRCSIYEYRPFACRTHVTFTPTSFWCDPSRVEQIQLPLISQDSFNRCYALILKSIKRPGIADIRDYFPSMKRA